MCFTTARFSPSPYAHLISPLPSPLPFSKSFSESVAAKALRDVLSALSYLHALGVIHRDLKPENLIYASPAADAVLKIGINNNVVAHVHSCARLHVISVFIYMDNSRCCWCSTKIPSIIIIALQAIQVYPAFPLLILNLRSPC